MPEIPTEAAAPAPTSPTAAEPVALDLTRDESPAAADTVIGKVAQNSGEPVASVTREVGIDRRDLLDYRGESQDAPYTPRDQAQDSARKIITLWLIGLFCVLIVLAFAALFMVGLKSGFSLAFFDKLKSLLDVLLGPVITLLSSAIGFYFGYQQGAGSLGRDTAKGGALPKTDVRR